MIASHEMADIKMPSNGDSKIPTKRKHWTTEEDSAITSLVSRSYDNNWAEIARMLTENFGITGRTSKQCRERWYNHLDPRLKKAKWTTDELLALFTAHIEHGNKWTLIKLSLPGRSENCIKNQFYSCLKRQFRKWKGHEPQRHQLHKYTSVLASQILSFLKKKNKKEDIAKTIDDIDPVIDIEEEFDDSFAKINSHFLPLCLSDMIHFPDFLLEIS